MGVERQYSGTLGKTANWQLGVSVNAVTEQASCPLDWRLFVPRRWDQGLGLDHFEGRSFGGWHHHVTLVSVAHGYLTLERLRRPKRRRRPAVVAAPGRAASSAHLLGRRLSPLQATCATLALPPRTSQRRPDRALLGGDESAAP